MKEHTRKPEPSGAQGGLESLDKLLQTEDFGQEEEVPRETILEAKELLNGAAQRLGSLQLNDQKIRLVLEAMTKNTSFDGARIEVREYTHLGGREVVENLQAIFGEYTSGHAYNVWFERDQGQWVIAYDPIPQGGNMRGA
ncbi:MAG: hypothetical protein U9O78_02435 [Patescibacteria group bacterium]|nr:hypothetical protein [Patescibacteria group bacterium]